VKKQIPHIVSRFLNLPILIILALLTLAPSYHAHSEGIEEIEEDRKEWFCRAEKSTEQKPVDEVDLQVPIFFAEKYELTQRENSNRKLYLTLCCRRTYD
jgi:hypothetical protein